MKRIGITGGIGSGKSTVCKLLNQYGIAIYDSDSNAKALMADTLRPAIEELFGSQAYTNGQLNRAYIASKVFVDASLLSQLNHIVHPAVACDFEHWCKQQRTPIVALESAILFECGFDKLMDVTIFVDAPLEIRIQRTMARDGRTRKEVEDRIANQSNDALTKADFVIINDTIENLNKQLQKIYTQLIEQ